MSKKESLARQSIIIEALRKRPMTFAEIGDKLDLESEIRGYDYRISKRTFNRDVEEISSLYHIDIKYDYALRAYTLEEDHDTPASERLLDAFNTFHAVQIGEQMAPYFEVERRRAAGMQHIFLLMHVVKKRRQVNIVYQKFLAEDAETRRVAPLALKEFKNRWYLVALDMKDDRIKTFGLDRIVEVIPGKEHFSAPADFNLERMFRNCFGIILPRQDKPQKVVLAFDREQGKYIRSMPLHSSQREIPHEGADYIISLRINLTYDFLMELRSYGPRLKILEPRELIEDMKNDLSATLAHYKA